MAHSSPCIRRRRCSASATLGGFKLQIEDRADQGAEALYRAVQDVLDRAYREPSLAGVFHELPDQRAPARGERRSREA